MFFHGPGKLPDGVWLARRLYDKKGSQIWLARRFYIRNVAEPARWMGSEELSNAVIILSFQNRKRYAPALFAF